MSDITTNLGVVTAYGYALEKGYTGTETQFAESLVNAVAFPSNTVNVTGTDPSITGVANTRYICGEVYTLSITPPQTGTIDVLFTSGSTATILTLPNTVKMPAWFSVEANMIYEINITDGVYGAVMSWQA